MIAALSLDESAVALDTTLVRNDSEVIIRSDTNPRVTLSLPVMSFEYRGEPFEFTAKGLPGDRRFTEDEMVTVVFPAGAPRQQGVARRSRAGRRSIELSTARSEHTYVGSRIAHSRLLLTTLRQHDCETSGKKLGRNLLRPFQTNDFD